MVKVGQSIKPANRRKEIEKENGIAAIRTFAVNVDDNADKIERIVHEELHGYLLQGKEYFRCSFAIARDTVVNVAEKVLGRKVVGIKIGKSGFYSDAQKEATARYNKKAYDRIEIKVKKGRKNLIFEYAAKRGKSVNQFIVELIDEAMKEDT